MATGAEHLKALRQYMKDPESVDRFVVLQAIIHFRGKKRPSFIPKRRWELMLSWG
jgi:hypothetical protein